ncbi:MAG: hypothetical protein EOP53_18090 [Sphingobacteriales bacterium]|nr:MAG: hypothetical protein EOP53_18090 [Sphingobacteriales bacterium]
MQRLFPYKNYLIAFFCILISLSFYEISRLKFYYDLEDFFPKEEAEMQFLRKYQSALEADDTYMFIAIDNGKSIFDSTFIWGLQQFTSEAKKLPSITQGNSLATLYDYIKTPIGFSRIPLLHINDFSRLPEDSSRILEDPRWRRDIQNALRDFVDTPPTE